MKYIPAAPSTLNNLQDLVTRAIERVPALMAAVVVVVARVDRTLAKLERQDASAEAVTTSITHRSLVSALFARQLSSSMQTGCLSTAARPPRAPA